MSDIKDSLLASSRSIGQIISDPLGSVSRVIGDRADPDKYNGQSVFRAIVLTSPAGILPQEYRALGGHIGYETKMDQSFKKFKIRITNKAHNPHAVLDDPCDITLAEDRCEQNSLISVHTTIVTAKHLGINVGSYILVRLHKNHDGTYNLQTGEFVDLIHANETGDNTLTAEVCESVKIYFKYGESYEAPPPIEMSSELRTLAQLYDSTPDIPGKAAQAPYLGSNPEISFKAPFDTWVKAFFYSAYAEGFGAIVITSGKRNAAKQEAMHQKWLAGERKLPTSCGYCPNKSLHLSGFAIDLNFYDKSGNFINSSGPRSTWEEFADVAKRAPMNLRWGGDFALDDPVHFDLNPKQWGDKTKQFMDQLDAGNFNVDTTGTGQTAEEQEAIDEELGNNEDDLPPPIRDAAGEYSTQDQEHIGPDEEESLML